MPVSGLVVCESTANVNAALRESLGSSIGCRGAEDSKFEQMESDDCLQTKLVASAKRVLLGKIEYEEVANYSNSMLDTFKSKYIILKPTTKAPHKINGNECSKENGNTTCVGSNNSHNARSVNGFVMETNGTSSDGNNNTNVTPTKQHHRPNSHELPQPKVILYPRENVRIGWKNSTRKWNIGVGMMNVGNTCYLNSTLQAIFHVPSMANWLLSDGQHMERCDADDVSCIICAMAKTLQASQSSQSAIRPYFVYSKLKSICKHLVMGRQEDAHEFLRYLVEAMEKSYLSRIPNWKDLDQYSKETTPLNQILGGYLKSAVRCLACGHVSVTFQHFQDLLLDIRKADTIEEALEGYFSRERLEDMGYKCEACKKKVSATKQFSLERAPIALCIQLKRFSMLGTKINKQIGIKPRLDLTKFASRKNSGEQQQQQQQLTYRLVAMVTHLGASQHCGHYTAIGLTETGTYYNYDDSYVRPISVQSVCNTNAYIIFYEMDTTTPARQSSNGNSSSSCTQVSGVRDPDAKENYQKVNGYDSNNNDHNVPALYNGRPSPQRIIGPQLPTAPPVTATAFGDNTKNNNKFSSSPLATANGNGKLSINSNSNNNSNRFNNTSNNSKIMIHFKNNNSSSQTNNAITVTSTTASATAISTTATTTHITSNTNSHSTSSKSSPSNGTMGNSIFNKATKTAAQQQQQQTAATKNGNKSSYDGAGAAAADNDNEMVISSTTGTTTPSSPNTEFAIPSRNHNSNTLPSMPKLFEHSHLLSHDELPSPFLFTKISSHKKSLVPYESASDDDFDCDGGGGGRLNEKMMAPSNGANNPRKRANSSASSSSSSTDLRNNDAAKMHKSVVTLNPTDRSKEESDVLEPNDNILKTDAIDEIFNFHKRNSNGYNSNNLENSTIATAITTPNNKFNSSQNISDNDDDDDDSSVVNLIEDNIGLEERNSSQSQEFVQHSHLHTPPSPPVIKTKTGLWQVTPLQPSSKRAVFTSPEQPKQSPSKSYRNPHNPFAKNDFWAKCSQVYKPTSSSSSSCSSSSARGNGYNGDSVSDATVKELLRQSHTYTSTSAFAWDGSESFQQGLKDETKQHRRDWERKQTDEDMDRGRQKRIKARNNDATTSTAFGYNPFQELDNQRRWGYDNAGGGGGQSYYGRATNYRRNNFQRHRGGGAFKFKRANFKYHRSQQQQRGGSGGGSHNYNNNNSDHHRRTS